MGHKAVDHLAKSLGYHEPVYAVVIDAGSTGSRVLAFSFHKAYLGIKLYTYIHSGTKSFNVKNKLLSQLSVIKN